MKRRYKLLIGFIISGIILTIIFFLTQDKKIYYLSLGDSLAVGTTADSSNYYSYGDYIQKYLEKNNKLEFYTKNFSYENYRSIDLLNDLNINKKIIIDNKQISIKNALIKADIVTLSIGMNDLFYKLNVMNDLKLNNQSSIYNYVDESLGDINKLLFELRKACKEQIIVIGFYNPFINYNNNMAQDADPIIKYANNKLENIVLKYNMTYINTYNIFINHPEYLSDSLNIHPTILGYKSISTDIINNINKKTLAK